MYNYLKLKYFFCETVVSERNRELLEEFNMGRNPQVCRLKLYFSSKFDRLLQEYFHKMKFPKFFTFQISWGTAAIRASCARELYVIYPAFLPFQSGYTRIAGIPLKYDPSQGP